MRGAAACLYLSRDEEGGCLPSRGHATRGAGCGECPCYPWSCPRVPMLSLVMSPCAAWYPWSCPRVLHGIPGHVPVCRMVSLVMSPCARVIPGHVPVCRMVSLSCPPSVSVFVSVSVRLCVRACVRACATRDVSPMMPGRVVSCMLETCCGVPKVPHP